MTVTLKSYISVLLLLTSPSSTKYCLGGCIHSDRKGQHNFLQSEEEVSYVPNFLNVPRGGRGSLFPPRKRSRFHARSLSHTRSDKHIKTMGTM